MLEAEQRTLMKVLRLTLAVEAGLALIYFLWSAFRPALPLGVPSPADMLWGIGAAAALWIANLFLFSRAALRFRPLRELGSFRREVIEPLVEIIPERQIPAIYALAGFGEELFFRGVVMTELGLVASSVIFSLLHFGTAVRRYPITSLFYIVIGALLGILCASHSLWSGVIAHAFYDAFVLYTLKRRKHTSS
jgi:membrane protease YdiL (CAAX protease family)